MSTTLSLATVSITLGLRALSGGSSHHASRPQNNHIAIMEGRTPAAPAIIGKLYSELLPELKSGGYGQVVDTVALLPSCLHHSVVTRASPRLNWRFWYDDRHFRPSASPYVVLPARKAKVAIRASGAPVDIAAASATVARRLGRAYSGIRGKATPRDVSRNQETFRRRANQGHGRLPE